MNKIGIITQYYKTGNYGGILQSYALCKALNKELYEVEQISFNFFSKPTIIEKEKKNIISIIKKIVNKLKRMAVKTIKEKRQFALIDFGNQIPHSKEVTKDNIVEIINDYDIFITGSDQVWNVRWYRPAFFLDFVPSNKKKISYAASMGLDSLTEEQRNIFRNSLKDFHAISVRERSDLQLLEGLTNIAPVMTLDPTLLLDKQDWDEICDERVIKEKYMFCYFLGERTKLRKLARQYAKQNNLKIVTFPYFNSFNRADINFGDYKLFDASPNKFLSLIKHSECVFTDSFHAVVFSHIYSRQYFVFNRNKKGEMSSRLYNITQLLGTQERYCDNQSMENINYLATQQPIDYTKELKELKELKKFSMDFLIDNIEGKE